MQYVWHLPENSWGPITFPIILEYDKVLSQVLPGDKPFIGFLQDEPKNYWNLAEMCPSAWGYVRGGEVLGTRSSTWQSVGFGAHLTQRDGLPSDLSDYRDCISLGYLQI